MNRSFWLLAVCAALSCREAPPKPAAEKPPAAAPEKPAPARQDHVTLLFAASTAGALVPCGCSPDQKGGLPRQVALVKKIRGEDPNALYIDAGDLLFEHEARPNEQILAQKEAK